MKTCCQGIQHRRNTNQNQGDKGEQRTRKWVLSKHNSKIMEQACSKYECGSVMDHKQICRLQFQVDLSIPVDQGCKTKITILCHRLAPKKEVEIDIIFISLMPRKYDMVLAVDIIGVG